MHPILFEVGGTAVHTYGALGAVGFLTLAGIALTRAKRMGIEPEHLADLIFVTALLSLLGSRLLFVWQHPEVVESWFDIVNAPVVRLLLDQCIHHIGCFYLVGH